jgi:hypothetical protein
MKTLIISIINRWTVPAAPKTRYEEMCEIKDRLYKDIDRLQQLQGTVTASCNVITICTDVLGADFSQRTNK